MGRSFAAACALVLAAPLVLLPAPSRANDRALPMQFALRLQGPAKDCGTHCRLFIAATGAITANTPRDFVDFTQGRDLTGATVVLDSDGGSVHGAIKLGREIRALRLDTTVGHLTDLALAHADSDGLRRARYSGSANCESMCAFVLLAGVHRTVPLQARVLVHQIWLGDRRSDPTAATYSAEDLVLVQRDIGKLAQYTVDMGASIEVLDLALRIPPWEPMHMMTREEIRDSRMITADNSTPAAATVAVSPQAGRAGPPLTLGGVPVTTISERRWAMVDHAGSLALARSQPLTHEGESIGAFDLVVSCGSGDSYDVSYSEHRHGGHKGVLDPLKTVRVDVGSGSAVLNVVSSRRRDQSDELVSYATGQVPAALIDRFAAAGEHSITVETTNAALFTGIRIGNTGASRNLPRLAAACHQGIGDRADLGPLERTGGVAVAK